MWVSGVESTQLLTTDKPKVCFLGWAGECFGGIHLDLSWQWLYMPTSINFVVGVSQGGCQGGQGYIQTMVYSIHNIRALWRTCLNTRSCGCFLRGYPPFLTHLAVYYTHISPGVCKNSGCLVPRHRFWRMLKSEKVNVSQFSTMPRKHSAAWKTILSIFFQLLTLVLYPECWCSPCCFWSWSHSPWSHPLNKSTFSKFSRDQSIWSHIEDCDLGAFSFGGPSNLEICLPKSQPKKRLWRSMLRNFIEQRGFVGLPAYRTTKG